MEGKIKTVRYVEDLAGLVQGQVILIDHRKAIIENI